jgi:hypothetical protein
MGALKRRAVQLIVLSAVTTTLVVPWSNSSKAVRYLAICPNGMVPNPGGYGCVPDMPGRGAPTQEVLTRCHGNYYLCIWPYQTP